MIGYTCAYLRYYHPAEFITAYLNNMESNEDIVAGTDYAKYNDIEIKNPEYGIFNTKYATQDNIIYKGLGSLKTVSDMSINSLSLLKNNTYNSFYDLLKDIKNNTCLKSNQIYALIVIDYFKKFGKTNKLITFIEYYDMLYNKKQIKKEKVDEFLRSCIKDYKETTCSYTNLKYDDILMEIWNNIPDEEIATNLKIQEQFEYQGYLTLEIPKDTYIFSVDLVSSKNEWCRCISLRNNKEQWFKFLKKPKKGSIIKTTKSGIYNKSGGEYKRNVMWIAEYEVVKK